MEMSLYTSLMDPKVSVSMIHFVGAVIALVAVTVTDFMIVYICILETIFQEFCRRFQ
jgi:hypothetical protein